MDSAVTPLSRRALLEQIIADGDVHMLFQPIVELDEGRLVAVEALARGPAGTPLHHPEELFAAAAEYGLLHELDTLCAARALQTARRYPGEMPPLLFVNSEPGAFTGPPTPELRAAIADPGPYRVVLEFTERALGVNPTGLLDVARMAHEDGSGIALDDLGADPLSLAFLPLIEPEVVKLDMHLLRDPFSSTTITTVTGVGAYAERTGAAVIAEGIETEQDRARAKAFGATWGQGWLFGRPGPLETLAGRPVDPYARLRPGRPEFSRPRGGTFMAAADRHPVHTTDLPMATAFAEHLLNDVAAAGESGVLLALDQDLAGFDEWLPRLTQVAARTGFTGVIRPAHAGDLPAAVHRGTVEPGDEAAVVIITPDKTTALCLRRTARHGEVELVLTHDPATVLQVARMLLGKLGSRVRRGGPQPVRPLQSRGAAADSERADENRRPAPAAGAGGTAGGR